MFGITRICHSHRIRLSDTNARGQLGEPPFPTYHILFPVNSSIVVTLSCTESSLKAKHEIRWYGVSHIRRSNKNEKSWISVNKTTLMIVNYCFQYNFPAFLSVIIFYYYYISPYWDKSKTYLVMTEKRFILCYKFLTLYQFYLNILLLRGKTIFYWEKLSFSLLLF